MYCTSCGAELEEGARFCNHCGAVIDASAQETVPMASDSARASKETVPMSANSAKAVQETTPMVSDSTKASGSSGPTNPLSGNGDSNKKGLSKNAKIGIGVGIAVVVIAIIVAISFVLANPAPAEQEETAEQSPQETEALIIDSTDSQESSDSAASSSQNSASSSTGSSSNSASSGSGSDSFTASSISGYNTYTNGRFGFSVAYPSNYLTADVYSNGSGMSFTDSSAGNILIDAWGMNNEAGETAQSRLSDLEQAVGIEGYTAHGDSWFVYSYEASDGVVVYIKEYVGSGSIVRMTITYPRSMASTGDPIVETVEPTLEPGDLTVRH